MGYLYLMSDEINIKTSGLTRHYVDGAGYSLLKHV